MISTCTEVDKVNRRVKIHFVGYSTQFDKWRYFGDDEGPEYFPFLRRERQFTPTDQSQINQGKIENKFRWTGAALSRK